MINSLASIMGRFRQFDAAPQYNPMLEAAYARAMGSPPTTSTIGEIAKGILRGYMGSKLGEARRGFEEYQRQRDYEDRLSFLRESQKIEDESARQRAEDEYKRKVGLLGVNAGMEAAQNYLNPTKYALTPKQQGNIRSLSGALPEIESYREGVKTHPEIYTEAYQNVLKDPETGLPDIRLAPKIQWVQGGLYDVNNGTWVIPPKAEGHDYTLRNLKTGEIQYRRLKSGESIPQGWEIYQAPLRGSIRQLGLNLPSMSTTELISLKRSYQPNLTEGYEGDPDSAALIDEELGRRIGKNRSSDINRAAKSPDRLEAPPQNIEDTQVLNGKTYIKINGRWYER